MNYNLDYKKKYENTRKKYYRILENYKCNKIIIIIITSVIIIPNKLY